MSLHEWPWFLACSGTDLAHDHGLTSSLPSRSLPALHGSRSLGLSRSVAEPAKAFRRRHARHSSWSSGRAAEARHPAGCLSRAADFLRGAIQRRPAMAAGRETPPGELRGSSKELLYLSVVPDTQCCSGVRQFSGTRKRAHEINNYEMRHSSSPGRLSGVRRGSGDGLGGRRRGNLKRTLGRSTRRPAWTDPDVKGKHEAPVLTSPVHRMPGPGWTHARHPGNPMADSTNSTCAAAIAPASRRLPPSA